MHSTQPSRLGKEQRGQRSRRQPFFARLGGQLPLPFLDVRSRVDVGAVRDELANHRRSAAAPPPTSGRSGRASLHGRQPPRRARSTPSPLRPVPVRAAVISAVSPSVPATFASTPAFNSRSMTRGVAVDARQIERRHAVAVRRLDVGAGADQAFGQLDFVLRARPSAARWCRPASGALTLTRWRSSAVAAALSPALTASTSRRSPVAAVATVRDQTRQDHATQMRRICAAHVHQPCQPSCTYLPYLPQFAHAPSQRPGAVAERIHAARPTLSSIVTSRFVIGV